MGGCVGWRGARADRLRWVVGWVGGWVGLLYLVAEAEVFSWDKASQEDIDSFSHGERHGNHSVGRGRAVQTANVIGEVV